MSIGFIKLFQVNQRERNGLKNVDIAICLKKIKQPHDMA